MSGNPAAVAVDYAERGWPVIPVWGIAERGGRLVCRCGRRDCDKPAKHPCGRLVPHGLKEASTNVDQVTDWWDREPDCNIGCLSGVVFDTLDVDHDDFVTGVADLPDCTTDGGPTVLTGSGRYHLLFAATGLPRRIRFSQYCDWLGVGGYQVMPPSRSVRGTEYRWWSSPDLELTAPPRALLDVLDPPVSPTAPPASTRAARAGLNGGGGWSPGGLLRTMAGAVEGSRNQMLFWCARRVTDDLRAGRVAARVASEALDDLDAVARGVGLSDHEVTQTIRSALRGRCR